MSDAQAEAAVEAGTIQPKVFISYSRTSPDYRSVSTELHRMGIATEKVRDVTDESNPLIRLADAVAGLVREAAEGQAYARELCALGVRKKVLVEL